MGSKCAEEKLRHFDPKAVAHTVEYAARLTDDQQRLSARFLQISDLVREASFYAEREAKELVEAKHVELAIEARIYRSNKLEEKIQDMIEEGSLLIDMFCHWRYVIDNLFGPIKSLVAPLSKSV